MSNPFSIATRSLFASLLLRSLYLSYSLEFFTFLSALKKFYSFFMFYVRAQKRNILFEKDFLVKYSIKGNWFEKTLKNELKQKLLNQKIYKRFLLLGKFYRKVVNIFKVATLSRLVSLLGSVTNFEFFTLVKVLQKDKLSLYKLKTILSFFLLSFKFFPESVKESFYPKIKGKSVFFKAFSFLWDKDEKGLYFNEEERMQMLIIRKNLINYLLKDVKFKLKIFFRKRNKNILKRRLIKKK